MSTLYEYEAFYDEAYFVSIHRFPQAILFREESVMFSLYAWFLFLADRVKRNYISICVFPN